MIKVSVIVPIYNATKYIDRCLNSLVNQTLKDVEIILIDDGSTDESGKICDEYEKKYDNIKVIHKNNEGAGLARNSGLDIASGEYVAFLDSDDYVDNTIYEVLYNNVIETKSDASFCGTNKVEKEKITKIGDMEDITINRETIIKESMPYLCRGGRLQPRRAVIAVWRGLYSLDLIKKYNIRFKSEKEFLSEDTLFNLDFFINANAISFINEYLHYQCIEGESLSRSNKINYHTIHNYYYYVKNFIEQNNEIDKKRCRVLLNKKCLEEYRAKVAMEIRTSTNKKDLSKKLKEICREEVLNKIIEDKQEWITVSDKKDRLFMFLIKYRCYTFLKIIFRLLKK